MANIQYENKAESYLIIVAFLKQYYKAKERFILCAAFCYRPNGITTASNEKFRTEKIIER